MNSSLLNTTLGLVQHQATPKEETMDEETFQDMTERNISRKSLADILESEMVKNKEDIERIKTSINKVVDKVENLTATANSEENNERENRKQNITHRQSMETDDKEEKRGKRKKKYEWDEVIIKEKEDIGDECIDKKVHKLTVSNFPTYWKVEDLKKFVSKEYGDVNSFYMSVDAKKYFMGSIQLHFDTKEEWKKAWDKVNGRYAEDQRVFALLRDCDTDSEEEPEIPILDNDSEEPPYKKKRSVSDGDEQAWRPDKDIWEPDPTGLYGLKEEYLQSLGVLPPITKWVHVSNFRCEKSLLKEVMELAGDVMICTVGVNVNQKYAKVCYSHPLEAVQAISMLNEQEFFGSRLKITMDNPITTTILPYGLKSIGPGLGVTGKPLKDIVRQFENYVKGKNSEINGEIFMNTDKTIGSYQSQHNMFQRNSIPNRISFNYSTPDYIPINPVQPTCTMAPCGPNVPIRPLGPPMGPNPGGPHPNMPMSGPRPLGPHIGLLPKPMGPVPNPPIRPGPIIGPIPNLPTSVELKNLPLDTTFPLLCEKMSHCGQVMSLQLGAPGFALVQFATPAQAEKCFQQYNKCLIKGNVIEARFR